MNEQLQIKGEISTGKNGNAFFIWWHALETTLRIVFRSILIRHNGEDVPILLRAVLGDESLSLETSTAPELDLSKIRKLLRAGDYTLWIRSEHLDEKDNLLEHGPWLVTDLAITEDSIRAVGAPRYDNSEQPPLKKAAIDADPLLNEAPLPPGAENALTAEDTSESAPSENKEVPEAAPKVSKPINLGAFGGSAPEKPAIDIDSTVVDTSTTEKTAEKQEAKAEGENMTKQIAELTKAQKDLAASLQNLNLAGLEDRLGASFNKKLKDLEQDLSSKISALNTRISQLPNQPIQGGFWRNNVMTVCIVIVIAIIICLAWRFWPKYIEPTAPMGTKQTERPRLIPKAEKSDMDVLRAELSDWRNEEKAEHQKEVREHLKELSASKRKPLTSDNAAPNFSGWSNMSNVVVAFTTGSNSPVAVGSYNGSYNSINTNSSWGPGWEPTEFGEHRTDCNDYDIGTVDDGPAVAQFWLPEGYTFCPPRVMPPGYEIRANGRPVHGKFYTNYRTDIRWRNSGGSGRITNEVHRGRH